MESLIRSIPVIIIYKICDYVLEPFGFLFLAAVIKNPQIFKKYFKKGPNASSGYKRLVELRKVVKNYNRGEYTAAGMTKCAFSINLPSAYVLLRELFSDNAAVYYAYKNNCPEMLKTLNISDNVDIAFNGACAGRNLELMKKLPVNDLHEGLRICCRKKFTLGIEWIIYRENAPIDSFKYIIAGFSRNAETLKQTLNFDEHHHFTDKIYKMACTGGFTEVINLCKQRGVDIEGREIIYYCKGGHLELVVQFLQKNSPLKMEIISAAIVKAALNGHIFVVDTILEIYPEMAHDAIGGFFTNGYYKAGKMFAKRYAKYVDLETVKYDKKNKHIANFIHCLC